MSYNYVQAFKEGHYYNEIVAGYLRSHGINCVAPELKIAQNSQEVKEMTLSEKDVVISASGSVIEVKSNRREFFWEPSAFPYKSIIVDTVSSYESKEVKPIAYVFVSRTNGAMVTIGSSTFKKWKKVSLYDKYQEITDDFYLADKSEIRPISDLVRHILDGQNTTNNRGRNSGRLIK
jgi:hypothetical protein